MRWNCGDGLVDEYNGPILSHGKSQIIQRWPWLMIEMYGNNMATWVSNGIHPILGSHHVGVWRTNHLSGTVMLGMWNEQVWVPKLAMNTETIFDKTRIVKIYRPFDSQNCTWQVVQPPATSSNLGLSSGFPSQVSGRMARCMARVSTSTVMACLAVVDGPKEWSVEEDPVPRQLHFGGKPYQLIRTPVSHEPPISCSKLQDMEVSTVMGVPLVIIHFCLGFSITKTKYLGGPPWRAGNPRAMSHSSSMSSPGTRYQGEFKENLREGYGVLTVGSPRWLDPNSANL